MFAVPPPRWEATRPFFLGSSGLWRLTIVLCVIWIAHSVNKFGDAFVETADDEQSLLTEARWDLDVLDRGLFITVPYLLVFAALVSPAIVAGLSSVRTARMVEEGRCQTPLERAHRDASTRRLISTWRVFGLFLPLAYALHSFAAGDIVMQRLLVSGGVFCAIAMWSLVDIVGARVTTIGVIVGSLFYVSTSFADLDTTPMPVRVVVMLVCTVAVVLIVYVINATERAKYASFSALADITARRLRAAEVFSSIMPRHVAEAIVSGGGDGNGNEDQLQDDVGDEVVGVGRDRIDDVASSTVIMVQVKLAPGLKAKLATSELMTSFLTGLFDACDTALDSAKGHGIALHLRRGHTDARGIRPDISKVENQPDLYIASCGLGGEPGSPHATWACVAAAEIAAAVRAFEESGTRGAFPGCTGLRVGVATGPVAGGLNGTGALVYSVYGSTVNLSARVAAWSPADNNESDGMVSCVHLATSVVEALRREGSLPFFDLTETSGVTLKGIMGDISVHNLHGLSRVGIEVTTAAEDRLAAELESARSFDGTSMSRPSGRRIGGGGTGGRSRRGSTARSGAAGAAYYAAEPDNPGTDDGSSKPLSAKSKPPINASAAQSLLHHALGARRPSVGTHRSNGSVIDMGGFALAAADASAIDGTDPVLEALITEGGALAKNIAGGGGSKGRDEGDGVDRSLDAAVERDFASIERPVAVAVGVLILLVATAQFLIALEVSDTLPDVDPTPLFGFAGALCAYALAHVALYAWPPRRREPRDLFVTAASCALTVLIATSGMYILWDVSILTIWSIFMAGLLPFIVPRSSSMITSPVCFVCYCMVVAASLVGPLKEVDDVNLFNTTPRRRMLVVADIAVLRAPLRTLGNGFVIFLIGVMVILQRSRAVQAFRSTRQLESFGRREAHRFESLVAKSLPAWAMERVMDAGQRISNCNAAPDGDGGENEDLSAIVSRDLENAVCFQSDLIGFTSISAGMGAAEVLRMLQAITAAMDKIALRHGVEKIGTVGDAYLAYRSGGTPNDVAAVCAFASDVISAVAELRFSGVQVRTGVGIGPLALGVLGTRMPMLRAWGPALEQAARMEQSGVASKITVSTEVENLLDQARGVLVPDAKLINVFDDADEK